MLRLFTCCTQVLSPTFGYKNENGDDDGDHEDEAGDGDADGKALLRDAEVVRIVFALKIVEKNISDSARLAKLYCEALSKIECMTILEKLNKVLNKNLLEI